MEETTPHKYITVAYELFTDNDKGIHELVEKAPAEQPFQFITGMGVALEAFEQRIAPLDSNAEFDFTLPVADAYGPYVEEHVIELDKNIFCIDGRFDKDSIYPGSVIPLVNADGNRFQGLVMEVRDKTVVVDLNHPLAGKDLHFRGHVVESRPATDEEIQGVANMLAGEGCGCSGGCHDDAGEGCCGGGCCGHH